VRYCYGEGACQELAVAEAIGNVKYKTIRNADTLAIVVQSIALMRASPKRDYGHRGVIKKRLDMPDHPITSIWECSRHQDEFDYQTSNLDGLHEDPQSDKEKKSAMLYITNAEEVLGPICEASWKGRLE
jgi:hypothetical protein